MAFSTSSAMNQARSFALGTADTNYLDFDFFAKRPELLKEVYESWDNKGFVDQLALTDREQVIYSEIFSNYESGLLARSFAVQTATSATAGSVTITLTADSLSTINTIDGAQVLSPLKEGDIIKLPNRKEAQVQSKSSITGTSVGVATAATTYTLVKSNLAADTSFDLGAYFTGLAGSGQRLTAPMAGFAEGSYDALEGIENPITRFEGRMQIIKTHSAITGSAAGDAWDVTLPGGVNRWYSKQRIEQGINHRLMEGAQMLVGNGGVFLDKNNKKVQTSLGLEGYIRAYGNVYDYPAGGITAASLDEITQYIKSIGGGTEYQWMMGSDLYRQVANIFRNLPGLQGGAIRYDLFGKSNAQQKAVDLGINSFVWNGITLHLQELSIFDHPQIFGITGYNYQSQGYLIPGTKQVVTSDNGRGESLTVDAHRMVIRYKEDVGGVSRRYMTNDRDKTITGYDKTMHEMLSHMGLQMVGLRQFILTQRSLS